MMILQNPDIIMVLIGAASSIVGVGWRFSTRIARLEAEIEYLRRDMKRLLERIEK